jgi:glycosyltransferase involved in cell wall biosynthesis
MITIVMAYYDNPTMLERHLREWEKYPKGFRAIIVDDGSKDAALPILKDSCPIPAQLYRVLIDKPWNQNGARNLAMTHATGWCLMTDMDHLLTVEEAKKICLEDYNENCAYKPLRRKADGEPYKRHPNSYLLTKDLYWDAGGYDEEFCGYYGTDATFRRQLGSRIVETDNFALTLYGREVIPDASTRTLGRKGSKYHVSNNKELVVKRKHGGRPIPPLNFPWVRQL